MSGGSCSPPGTCFVLCVCVVVVFLFIGGDEDVIRTEIVASF